MQWLENGWDTEMTTSGDDSFNTLFKIFLAALIQDADSSGQIKRRNIFFKIDLPGNVLAAPLLFSQRLSAVLKPVCITSIFL